MGDAYSEAAPRSLGWDGKLLVAGFSAGEMPRVPPSLPLLKSCDICGLFWGVLWATGQPTTRRATRRPRPSSCSSMSKAAIAHLAERQSLGKVVVAIR